MMDPNCPINEDNPLGRLFVPFLCFLYGMANRGHALEVSIGVPNWMAWFSTPDLYLLQLFESFFLVLLSFFIVPITFDILKDPGRLRSWDWKTDVRLVGGLGLTAWLEMCLVSAFTCQARSTFENTDSKYVLTKLLATCGV